MLNSVSDPRATRTPSPERASDRRRQLVGIGLAKIVETPIQDLSLDDIAAEAGISRGLLFHYFPTKTDFYLACIAAAGRRMLRTTAPDEDLPGEEQVEMVTRLMVEQIERRRDFYLALVHGHGVADPRVSEVMDSVRDGSTDRVMVALDVPAAPARRRTRVVGLHGGPGAHLVGSADRRTPGPGVPAGRGVRRRAPRPAGHQRVISAS